MTRSLAVLTTALVAAAVAFTAAPQRSEAAISVGIGEQSASMFTNPLFTDLGIKRARYFPSWNVALKRAGARLARHLARGGREGRR